MNSRLSPFHLAFPVNNIAETKKFFVDIIGCSIGRQSENWIDFDFFGHQISAHLNPKINNITPTNIVDNDNIPVRHFGLVVPWKEWHKLVGRFKAKKIQFQIKPHIRFKRSVGEQATLFILDPSGNAIEFKSFKDEKMLFKH